MDRTAPARARSRGRAAQGSAPARSASPSAVECRRSSRARAAACQPAGGARSRDRQPALDPIGAEQRGRLGLDRLLRRVIRHLAAQRDPIGRAGEMHPVARAVEHRPLSPASGAATRATPVKSAGSAARNAPRLRPAGPWRSAAGRSAERRGTRCRSVRPAASPAPSVRPSRQPPSRRPGRRGPRGRDRAGARRPRPSAGRAARPAPRSCARRSARGECRPGACLEAEKAKGAMTLGGMRTRKNKPDPVAGAVEQGLRQRLAFGLVGRLAIDRHLAGLHDDIGVRQPACGEGCDRRSRGPIRAAAVLPGCRSDYRSRCRGRRPPAPASSRSRIDRLAVWPVSVTPARIAQAARPGPDPDARAGPASPWRSW